MHAKKRILVCLFAALSVASSLALGGVYTKQIHTYGGYSSDTFGASVPAGATVWWETQTWGAAAASLSGSGAGTSFSSYSSGDSGDTGNQTTTSAGTVSGSMTVEAYGLGNSSFAISYIYMSW